MSMSSTNQSYIDANRAAWNASAPHHLGSARYQRLLQGFAKPGFSCLDDILTERLRALGVAGKDVAQLCCNNGCEILSVKNLGAGRCVGFDQSGAFLEQARAFRAVGGIDCDFLETDVNKIPGSFDASFDIVLITIGALCWMPDLPAFMAVVERLLRPGGAVCLCEEHPILNMMEPFDLPDDPTRLVHSYFKDTPFEDEGPIVYDGTVIREGLKQYSFVQTLADIITACLGEGLAIEHFREFPHNISSADYEIYSNQPAQLPLCYMLVARKSS